MKTLLINLLLITTCFGQLKSQNTDDNTKTNMETTKQEEVYQLRIYQLFEGNKKEFYERFENHAIRIMKKYNFNIIKMWESYINGVPEFVYLLKWENKDALEKGWTEFMADEEWKNIKDRTHAKYGYMVGGIEDRTLVNTPIVVTSH